MVVIIIQMYYNLSMLSEECWLETTLNLQRQKFIIVLKTTFVTQVASLRFLVKENCVVLFMKLYSEMQKHLILKECWLRLIAYYQIICESIFSIISKAILWEHCFPIFSAVSASKSCFYIILIWWHWKGLNFLCMQSIQGSHGHFQKLVYFPTTSSYKNNKSYCSYFQ